MTTSRQIPDLPAFQLLGLPVEIPKIEKALQDLFVESGDPDSGESSGVARASLINLAVYNENQEELETDADVLSELTSESACRSLLINAHPGAGEPQARAWVQVHCQIDKNGKKTVCTEQISFFLTGGSPGLLRNIVFSHLDSDLPLAFWWRGEFSDSFEQGLYSRIDRLLFDSERWESPRNQFIRLLEAQSGASRPFVIHDLAFTRLNSIRTAVANAFDHPGMGSAVESLSEVKLRFAAGYRMSALYLAAWIADRLKAKPEPGQSSADRFAFSSAHARFPSSFTISLKELSEDRKGTVEVDFVLKGSRVEISRCQTRDFLRTLIHQEEHPTEEDWLPARKLTDVALVSDILNRAGRNRTYGRVLPLVQELLTF